jgi:hypothetical protein
MYLKQLWDSNYDETFDFDLKVEDILLEARAYKLLLKFT